MFRKSNSTNIYYIRFRQLVNELREKREDLIARVQELIAKKNVIDLYPEGADKNAAIVAFESKQKTLLNYIAQYDNVLIRIANYDASKCEPPVNQHFYSKESSHDVIEEAYKMFMKGEFL